MILPVLFHPKFKRISQLNSAVESLNANQDKFYFKPIQCDLVPNSKNEIDADVVRDQIISGDGIYNQAAIITESPFNNNWFSMTSTSGSIISTSDWEEYFAPPGLKTFIQLELILHTASSLGDLTDSMMEKMAHQESIGCLFDFCSQKPDIKYKIIGGHLCGACADKLRSYGASSDDIQVLRTSLDIMRLDSIGRAKKVSKDRVFVAMRFSSNDENDNCYKHGVLPAFESMGIEVVRADDKPSSGIMIDKIFRMIDHSWAVVVISDSSNLNVFFEFGYSVGQNKPIFLVSSTTQFKKSPTDIKGYEQIVYPDGDYDGLNKNIKKFLEKLPRFSS